MRDAEIAILCGGLGTRLGELTAETPKPLLHVADLPFLDHLLLEIGRFGFKRIVLLACFEAEAIEEFVRTSVARARFDLEIAVSIEPERAGTGGALRHAAEMLADEFIVLNGDTWLGVNFHALMASRRKAGASAAMGLRWTDEGDRYNFVSFDGKMIPEFRTERRSKKSGYINGGIIACGREILERLPEKGSLEDDVWPQLAREGKLSGFAADGTFLDIGVPETFAQAQTLIPAQHRRGAVFFDRDGVLNIDHGHVGSIDRFEWVEGAREAVKLANDAGLYVFVVTNQAGVAKGYYDEASVLALHQHMQNALNEIGAHIDDFRYCPYHVDAVSPDYRQDHPWRKPKPGMLLDLLDTWSIDPARSIMVGDKQSDLDAAGSAGIRSIMFDGGRLDLMLESAI